MIRKVVAALLVTGMLAGLLGMPDAEILCFDDGAIHACKYEETESYQVTELFLSHRKQILKRLLDCGK